LADNVFDPEPEARYVLEYKYGSIL
jgi:hypothetical protein